MIVKYMTRLKELLQKALALQDKLRESKISLKAFQRQGHHLKEMVEDFPSSGLGRKPMERIAKRLLRYKKEMFTFLTYPQVDATNNHAEREIRPCVILRKVTFGNDTEKGARNHSILMSILQTSRKNGRSPPDVFRQILATPKPKRMLSLLGIRNNKGRVNFKRRRAGRLFAVP